MPAGRTGWRPLAASIVKDTVVQLFAERLVQFDRMHNRTLVNEGTGE
ncbi:MAG: hypothetical protein STSR0009_20150 [Methanoregula sp.]